MKVHRMQRVEIEVTAVRIQVPNRYADEPDDQFLQWPDNAGYDKNLGTLDVTVDLETGKIRGWPEGATFPGLNLKVCDEGSYTLIGPEDQPVYQVHDEYVPEWLTVGVGGDYLKWDRVSEDGRIQRWPAGSLFMQRLIGQWIAETDR